MTLSDLASLCRLRIAEAKEGKQNCPRCQGMGTGREDHPAYCDLCHGDAYIPCEPVHIIISPKTLLEAIESRIS